MRRESLARNSALIAAGLFAFAWAVLRANLQSVTLDEADSYTGYAVAKDWPAYWYPSSGNHVLNSILTRLITAVFGLSHLTLRAPALIGAACYIYAAGRLCVLVAPAWIIALPLFAVLVYNPLVMDYMVAARGYGLALGLLVTAVWLLGLNLMEERQGARRIAASVCIGLSFCSNFSFAYIGIACLLVYFLLAERWSLRAALDLFLPAGAVTLVVCGSVLAEWPRGQLYYGARSLSETWRSLVSSCFPPLNPFVVNALLMQIAQAVQPFLPGLFICVGLIEIGVLALAWRAQRSRFALYLSAAAVTALLLHWLQFKLFHILLPLERTAIFFAVLPALVFGAATAASPPLLRRAGAILLFAGAFYFIGCLRLTYFNEWRFGADVRAAFPVLQELCRRYRVSDVPTCWEYSSSLNFYRLYYGETAIEEFHFQAPPPPGAALYILPLSGFKDFIAKQGLKILYRGKSTDLVIAARPDLGNEP